MEALLISLILFLKRIHIRISSLLAGLRKEKITVIAMGDSWLNFTLFDFWPKFKTIDTVDWMKKMNEFNIVDAAIPGYRLSDEIRFKMFRYCVDAMEGKFVILLSFGGNDLTKDFDRFVIGSGARAKINKKLLQKYVHSIYFKALKFYITLIHYELHSLNMQRTKRHIRENTFFLIHGYDYFRPDVLEKNGMYHERFVKLFNERHMTVEQTLKIAKDFVDITNLELKKFCARLHNMTFVDLRGSLGTERADAIHPTPQGYKELAERFTAEIKKLI